MRVCKSWVRVRVSAVAMTASLGEMVESSDIMFAIAACSDILETVSFPILPLDDLPHILGTVMGLAGFINVNVVGTVTAAATCESARQLASLPITTQFAQCSSGALWLSLGCQSWNVHRHTNCRRLITGCSRVIRRQRGGCSRSCPVSRALSKVGVEFINILSSEVLRHVLDISLFIVGAEKQVRKRVEPGLVSLSGCASELDGSSRRDDDQALAMESRRTGVIVSNDTHSLDRNTLGLELSATSS